MTVFTGDTFYGVPKANGFVIPGTQALGSRQEYITITSTVDIRTYAANLAAIGAGPYTDLQIAAAVESQAALDKLIQIVSTRGQPVIMGAVGANSPYTLYLVNEHFMAWGSVQTATVNPGVDFHEVYVPGGHQLLDRITEDGINYGFISGTVTVLLSGVLT